MFLQRQVVVTVDPEEKEAWKEAAAEAGAESLSAFIRDAVHDATRTVAAIEDLPEDPGAGSAAISFSVHRDVLAKWRMAALRQIPTRSGHRSIKALVRRSVRAAVEG